MDCCKLLFKHIMGAASEQTTQMTEEIVRNTLSSHGLAMYEECLDAVKKVQPNFGFNVHNLL